MNIIKTFFVTLIILISLTTNSQSKELDSISDNDWLVSLEEYFFSLGNVKGEFTQIDQIGNIAKGIFYSNGRGSIRFEYSNPSEMLIIINKGIFAIKERKDSKVNYYSLEDSPLANLLSKDLALDNFHINTLEIEGRVATIELRTKKNSLRNSIFITADYPQPILRQWKIIDTQKKETTVFFSKIKSINSIMDSFFEIK
jgi:outer membrane lipoprotein-sorting protein